MFFTLTSTIDYGKIYVVNKCFLNRYILYKVKEKCRMVNGWNGVTVVQDFLKELLVAAGGGITVVIGLFTIFKKISLFFVNFSQIVINFVNFRE